MERLTEENPYWLGEEFWTSVREPDEDEIDQVYERLWHYENTGLTPEQVRELAEKQKPMKVEKLKSAQYPYRCPACGYLLEIGYKHCISCGQRLEYEKEADHE